MRIACVYLPSFPLQAALVAAPGGASLDPERSTTPSPGPIAVVSHLGGRHTIGAPQVVACSRAAWSLGVRPQMTAATARALVPGLHCLVADVSAERRLLCAVADSLLAVSPRVDVGGDVRGQHHALYVEVPAGKRGGWFGARVVELLAVHGLRGRIGIADDRFTAYVAASTVAAGTGASEEAVVCVPRGGSAAFLAPHSLSLLSLAPEVQHMLEALGVKTLGAFAELPPPSVAHAWDADFQALARGDGGASLSAYRPGGPIVERAALDAEASLGAAVEAIARRLARRLVGRGRAADDPVELTVQLHGDGDVSRAALVTALPREDELADAIGRVVGDEPWRWIEATTGDASTAATPAPVLEPAAASEAQAAVAPLTLAPQPSVLGDRVEHRRTRRGKQRPRIAAGQARLFANDA